jgi:hypothetical protein
VWLFYQLVLRRLTFYTWNRWYLVVCTAVSFLLPLINISPVLEKNNWTTARFVSAIPQIPDYTVTNIVIPAPGFSEQLLSWLPYIIGAGAVAMLVRLLFQYFSLLAMRRSSQLLLNGPVKVYQVDKPVIPFSFGNAIYLNQHLHEEEELKEIIRHEFIHVKQKHTVDIIWSEVLCVLTWYNPFSWLLRKAIRQNLEFIADQQVLKTGLDRRQYQYLLLKVIGVPTYSIASNFNFTSLKKRIAMMNKVKSAKLHLVRFLLLLPVVAIILVAFRNAAKHGQQVPPPVKALINDTTPAKKFPENVRSFHTVNNRVTVTLKDGKEETYNLNNHEERAAFENKYGKLPEPPTPPTPAIEVIRVPMEPPAAPRPAHDLVITEAAPHPEIPGTPHVLVDGFRLEYQDDYNDKGYSLKVVSTKKGPYVIIVHKSKKEPELVSLEDWKKDKKFEEKYGKLPPGPPPPPEAPPVPIEQEMPVGVPGIQLRDYEEELTKVYNNLAKDKLVKGGSYSIVTSPHALTETYNSVAPLMKEQVRGDIREVDVISKDPRHIVGRAPGDREIIAVIKSNMSAEDLTKLKTGLKEKGYTLLLEKVKHENGKIVLIDGKLNFDKHTGHFQSDDFDAIIISRDDKVKGLLRVEIIVKDNKQEQ